MKSVLSGSIDVSTEPSNNAFRYLPVNKHHAFSCHPSRCYDETLLLKINIQFCPDDFKKMYES